MSHPAGYMRHLFDKRSPANFPERGIKIRENLFFLGDVALQNLNAT
jgi:hypothetical protein